MKEYTVYVVHSKKIDRVLKGKTRGALLSAQCKARDEADLHIRINALIDKGLYEDVSFVPINIDC